MKLSIRMKIFLPVMFLLIAFPLAAWFVFSYTLEGHMNYNARRDLDEMVKSVEELTDEFSNIDAGDDGNAPDDKRSLLPRALPEKLRRPAGDDADVLGVPDAHDGKRSVV